ncbi:16S rRNA (uracil(1498)-N(3))-methyltransferase [Leptolyngbya sp. FACHB-261]|nr:16S rRNA (uracil(1498)-N(3))-methyltransferase [Leptolyngbya sp. FACHB-261]
MQRLVIAPEQIQGNCIRLTAPQQHYLGNVLRLATGAQFIAMDGQGHWWRAQLEANAAMAQLLEALAQQAELPVKVSVAVALPKGSGFDEVVRQLTELGASQIWPLRSERTLMQPGSGRLERWRRIAQEAAEQAERTVVPELAEPLSFSELLQATQPLEQKYICVTRSQPPSLWSQLQWGETLLLTGPEGGWTESEQQQALAAGFQPVSLGSRILRAVTAPVVALGLVAAFLEEGSLTS